MNHSPLWEACGKFLREGLSKKRRHRTGVETCAQHAELGRLCLTGGAAKHGNTSLPGVTANDVKCEAWGVGDASVRRMLQVNCAVGLEMR
jgi:hypothetical protein